MTREEFINHALTNPADMDALFQAIRKNSIKDHRFDFNYSLAEGKQAEELVKSLFDGTSSVEVKLDAMTGKTGKVLVEYGHSYGKNQTSVPSGILTSEAEWYAIVFGGDKFRNEVAVMIKRKRLLAILNEYGHTHPSSGRPGNSDFLLVNKEHLFAVDIKSEEDK